MRYTTGDAGVGYGGTAPVRRTAALAALAAPTPLATLACGGMPAVPTLASVLATARTVPDTVEVRAVMTRRTVARPSGRATQTRTASGRCGRCGGTGPDLSIGRPDGSHTILHSECYNAPATVRTFDTSIIVPVETPTEASLRMRSERTGRAY